MALCCILPRRIGAVFFSKPKVPMFHPLRFLFVINLQILARSAKLCYSTSEGGAPMKMQLHTEKTGRVFASLFLLAALLVGIIGSGYGRPWDEPAEMDILRMNLWEYSNALGLPNDVFQARAAVESSVMPISQSIERDHGQSAYYLLSGVVMDSKLSEMQRMQIWHLYTWLLFWLGGVALYFVCRELSLPRFASCLAVAMLLLSPQFFAHGHYNNKDIVLMSLVLMVLRQALALSRKQSFPRGVLFALAGAFAANTKIAGLAIWGLCGLFVVARLAVNQKLRGRVWSIAAVTFLSFLGCYLLLTPALWSDPVAYLRFVAENAVGFTRWNNGVLFRGMVFETSKISLPWYYLPYMMLVTTPLWMILLIGIGQIVALVRLCSRRTPADERLSWLLVTLLWSVPLGFAVLSGTTVYNGWRHFFFIYGPMLVLATSGVVWIWQKVRPYRAVRRISAVLLCACMATTAIDMIVNHPYQYAYFNPLVKRGQVNHYLERDYWNVSVLEAVEEINRIAGTTKGDQPAAIAGTDLFSQNGLERGIELLKGPKAITAIPWENAETAQYVLVNHTYQSILLWEPDETLTPFVEIIAYGEPLVTVYRRLAP